MTASGKRHCCCCGHCYLASHELGCVHLSVRGSVPPTVMKLPSPVSHRVDVELWGPLAERAAEVLDKGMQVAVQASATVSSSLQYHAIPAPMHWTTSCLPSSPLFSQTLHRAA